VSVVIDRRVSYEPVDDPSMGQRLRAAELPEIMVGLRVALGVAIREGFYADLSPQLEQLTGQLGRTTLDVLRAHPQQLRAIFPDAPRADRR
jgi:hypothetical protein